MKRRQTVMRSVMRTRCAWNGYVRQVALSEGIPDSYRPILMFLHRNPGASQKSVAEFVGVTTSAINQVVKGMLEEGYLRKEIDPSDKRSSKLFLTESGEAVGARLRERLEEADGKITAFLGEETENLLIERLDAVSELIRKELGQC